MPPILSFLLLSLETSIPTHIFWRPHKKGCSQMWLVHLSPGPAISIPFMSITSFLLTAIPLHSQGSILPPLNYCTHLLSLLCFNAPRVYYHQSIGMIFSLCQPLNAYSFWKAGMLYCATCILTTLHNFCHTVEYKRCHEIRLQSGPTCSISHSPSKWAYSSELFRVPNIWYISTILICDELLCV